MALAGPHAASVRLYCDSGTVILLHEGICAAKAILEVT